MLFSNFKKKKGRYLAHKEIPTLFHKDFKKKLRLIHQCLHHLPTEAKVH